MKPADEEKLRELAHTVVADAGVGLDLEEVIVIAAGRRSLIRVVVDGDNGVSLDAAADVSRALSAALDALDAAGKPMLGAEPYTLEVTSPGIGRPLTEERHFRRARGRLVSVKLLDGSSVEGRVRRVSGAALELLTGTDAGVTGIPLSEIRRAKIEVEFAKVPPAHAALLAADGFVDPARAFDEVEADEADPDDADDSGDFFDGDDEHDSGEFEGDDLETEHDHQHDHESEAADLDADNPSADLGSAKEGQQ